MPKPIDAETLANHVDRLAGQIAALAAILAHVPGMNLDDSRNAKSVSTHAQMLAPNSIPRSGLSIGAPKDAAKELIEKITSISQSVDALRAAGGAADR